MRAEWSLRHLPFFEALAGMNDADHEWRTVSAGLVTLRLFDAWIEEGPSIVAADSWSLAAAREALEALPSTTPERAILGGIIDAMVESAAITVGIVAPRLMAFGRALDFGARWPLAADVYRTIVAHAHPGEDADIVIDANLRLGFCCRIMGRWSEAAEAYGAAAAVATAAGDMVKLLRTRVADAKLAIDRGNLPQAESILDETIGRARGEEFTEVRSIALHDRADVARRRGDYERAIRLAYEALEGLRNPDARDRVLADIAVFFEELGMRSAARDAHLVLAATAQAQYSRWVATLNLLEIAALDRVEPAFEMHRRELMDASLPPTLEATYHLHVGRGYQIFGRPDAARTEMRRAFDIASRHQLNQLAFQVEQALQELERGSVPTAPAPLAAAESAQVKEVAAAVGRMRVAAVAS